MIGREKEKRKKKKRRKEKERKGKKKRTKEGKRKETEEKKITWVLRKKNATQQTDENRGQKRELKAIFKK